ncbi:MAG TPA: HYR domain-containing protein [Thermoanaerobaculia bacterium]
MRAASFVALAFLLTSPALAAPPDVVTEAHGPNGSVVHYDDGFGTDGNGRPLGSCAPASGSLFPIGRTVARCSDGSTFAVEVRDSVAPLFHLPGPIYSSSPVRTTGALTAELRAVHGRVYTLFVECVDAAGNRNTTSVTVRVARESSEGSSSGSEVPQPLIDHLSTNRIPQGSGEHGLRVEGNNFQLGAGYTDVILAGPAGTWELAPAAFSTTHVEIAIPAAVVQSPGRYSVVVRNYGTSNRALVSLSEPAHFDVTSAAPVLHVPQSVSAEATGPHGAVATFAVTASAGSVTCSHASGSLFPLGITTVRCTASVDGGGSAAAEFPVSIIDTTPPVMTLPREILLEATQREGAVVHFEATAVDIVDGNVAVHCFPASGSLFAVNRTTEVRCSATDAHTRSTIQSFPVTVVPAVVPMLMLPADISVPATSHAGAIVEFEVRGMDPNEGHVFVTCTPESGSLFPIGRTTVTCSGTASSNNATTTGTFRVTVRNEFLPTLELPDDITVEASSSAGAAVTYEVTSNGTVVCTPPSASLFPIGTTQVSCTAYGSNAKTVTGTFNVTVVESGAPTLILPDNIAVEAESSAGTVVVFEAISNGTVVCTPPSGSLFTLGMTTVTCTATAANGKTTTGEFTVTVFDANAPIIHTITASPNVLTPANHKLVSVTVKVIASEGTARIVNVTANEAIDAPGSGNTEVDWRITGPLTVDLRAERSGQGTDRIYTIHIEVTDDAGNTARGTVTVRVPKEGNGESAPPPPPGPGRRRATRR